MKYLVLFSLKRKFFNKSFFLYLGIIFIICCGVFYSDKIVNTFFSSLMSPTKVKINFDDEFNLCELMEPNFKCDNEAEIVIDQRNSDYLIKMPASAHPNLEPILTKLLLGYEQEKRLLTLPAELASQWIDMSKVKVDFEWESVEYQNNNQDYLVVIISSIYFMMLGFASGLANEIAAEKLGNMLEIIGTSVSLKIHYYSKIIIGWISIGVSIGAGFLIMLLVGFSRFLFDNGIELIKFLQRIGLTLHFDSLSMLIKTLFQDDRWLFFLISLLFLWVGILFIQLILVIISSKLKTMEETNALQSPVYIALLVLYYVSVFMNYPQSMISGFGYYCSFLPILSMVFMPSRLLLYSVPFIELLMASLIALFSLWLLIYLGQNVYIRNVLNIGRVKK